MGDLENANTLNAGILPYFDLVKCHQQPQTRAVQSTSLHPAGQWADQIYCMFECYIQMWTVMLHPNLFADERLLFHEASPELWPKYWSRSTYKLVILI